MEIIKYKRDDAEGAIIVYGQDQYIAVTLSSSKKFKSMKGAHRFLDSYGYRPITREEGSSIGETSSYKSAIRNSRAEVYPGGQDEYGRDLFRVELRESDGRVSELYMTKQKLNRWLQQFEFKPEFGKSSEKKRDPRVGGRPEWWVVIEHNYPRRTDRMIDYDYGKGNMFDRVLMKIIDWAYNNNDKGLIKSLNQMKSVEDFLEKNASKYDWGYSTDIYGDNSWEIIRLTKDNLSEMGERYPDIYDRFSEEDFE